MVGRCSVLKYLSAASSNSLPNSSAGWRQDTSACTWTSMAIRSWVFMCSPFLSPLPPSPRWGGGGVYSAPPSARPPDAATAPAILHRREPCHVGRRQAHHVEGADQVHLDDAGEIFQRHGAGFADDARGAANARAVDQHACRTVRLAHLGEHALRGCCVGDVA